MTEIELEKTYLAKYLSEGLLDSPFKVIKDIYIPKEVEHSILRIRQKGDKYEITKKQPVQGTDSSEQYEHTVQLTKQEFQALEKVSGKKVSKIRYYYNHNGIQAEVDVFQDDLKGLVLVDFEFKEVADKDNFQMPDFCLADVTQDKCFAGGMLAGKKYSDIEMHLKELEYIKII
jgi:CYTH domain-containing protein